MTKNRLSTENFDKFNITTNSARELCVRQGLRELLTAESLISGAEFISGKSFKYDRTDELRHYVALWDVTAQIAYIYILDEDMQVIQKYLWGYVRPLVVTAASVGNQVMICSPQLPSVWGQLGGEIHQAVKADSVNLSYTTIDIPKGICVEWGSRIVISDGDTLYFSDGWAVTTDVNTQNAPRAFVAANVANPTGAGVIRGMHVGPQGNLIVVSNTGIWGLSYLSGSLGQLVKGSWVKIQEFEYANWEGSAVANGRVWGLDKHGLILLDAKSNFELKLNNQAGNKHFYSSVNIDNFSYSANVYQGAAGPWVSVPKLEYAFRTDQDTGINSWISYSKTGFKLEDVMADTAGEDLLVTNKYILKLCGEYDTDDGYVYGILGDQLEIPADNTPTLREVHVSSDTQDVICVAALGESLNLAPIKQDPTLDNSVNWTDTNTFITPPAETRRINMGSKANEIYLEVGARGPLSRIKNLITVLFLGAGEKDRDR